MVLRKKGPLAMLVLGASLCSQLNAQEWEATARVEASNTNVQYSAENRFGAKNNATRNYNFGIDILAPPPQPAGINTYQRTDNNTAVLRNYINPGNENISFRGFIQYNNFTPTSSILIFNNLLDTNWALMTFTDAAHSQLANSYSITNGQAVALSSNIMSYIITKKPKITNITAQQSGDATEATLQSLFYCYDAVSLEVQATPMLPDSFMPIGNITLSNGNGTFSALPNPAPSRFFRVRAVVSIKHRRKI